MDETSTAILADWMIRQRWYAGKGRVPELTEVGAFEFESDEPGVTVRTLLLLESSGAPTVYQVPVTIRDTVPRGWGQHFIGRAGETDFWFDGAQDPAYTRALLRLVVDAGVARADGASAHGTPARPLRLDGARVSSRVLTGEQSNTSIVYTVGDDSDVSDGVDGGRAAAAEPPVIVKIFRTLHAGDNPDVVLQTAISAAGSQRVPAVVGSVAGTWPDPRRHDGTADGHLAFAQEFLPGVEDAWRVALRAASAGVDFRDEARELGRATAEVHRVLAEVLPRRDASVGDTVAAASSWHSRLATAVGEVPELERHRAAAEALYDRAQQGVWPALQRVHGDYHLGQVLFVPGRGWVLLDFEGEPLRPMSERDVLDQPLRDVAGMLRSFDYVAGSTALAGGAAGAWAEDARAAFLDGYRSGDAADVDAHRALLDAFELDKALYEAVYEKRNRPDWLPIPVDAVGRLVGRTSPAASDR